MALRTTKESNAGARLRAAHSLDVMSTLGPWFIALFAAVGYLAVVMWVWRKTERYPRNWFVAIGGIAFLLVATISVAAALGR